MPPSRLCRHHSLRKYPRFVFSNCKRFRNHVTACLSFEFCKSDSYLMADLIGVPTNAPQLLTPVRPQSDQLQWSLIRRLLQAEKILESRSAPGPDRMAAAAHADLPLALRVPTYSVALPSPPFSSRYAAHHSNKYQLSLLDHLSQVRRARHQPTRHRRSRAVFPEDRLAVPRSGTPECRRADPVTSTNRVGRRNWRQTDHSLRHTRRCAKRPLHYCCGQISIVGQPLRPLTANKCRHREQPYHRVGSLRKKMGVDLIETVRGMGYRLRADAG